MKTLSLLFLGISLVSCATQASLAPVNEVLVKGGTTRIGDDKKIESYTHELDSYYMAKYEFTWDLFAMVVNHGMDKGYLHTKNDKLYPLVGTFPEYFEMIFDFSKNSAYIFVEEGSIQVVPGAEKNPASNISWFGAAFFCNLLSELNNYKPSYDINTWKIIAGTSGYRMPTFEEWEYAAKGGREGIGYVYAGSDDAMEVGWFVTNSEGKTHPVGLLKPNELGLYDMNGNVHEFCTEMDKNLKLKAGLRLQGANTMWRGGAYSSAEVDTYHFQQNPNYPDFLFPFKDVGFRTVRPGAR